MQHQNEMTKFEKRKNEGISHYIKYRCYSPYVHLVYYAPILLHLFSFFPILRRVNKHFSTNTIKIWITFFCLLDGLLNSDGENVYEKKHTIKGTLAKDENQIRKIIRERESE